MSAKKFLCSIDLNGNELQNVVFHNLAVAPSNPSDGAGYFDTATEKFMLYFNSTWNDITGRVVSITSTAPAITFDNTDPASPIINVAEADGTNAGFLSSAHFTLLNNATAANTNDTLVLRDGSGNVAVTQLTASVVTGLAAPTDASDAANKAYVDNLAATGIRIIGTIDASGEPNYPSGVVGDAYHITVAGKVGGASGELVEVGDLLVITADNAGGDEAAVGADSIIMQKNIDNATDLVAGIVRKATAAEISAGVNTDTFVTPGQLTTVLAQFDDTTNKVVATVGDATNLGFTVNHAFNSQYVHTQVFDTVSNEQVEACVVNTDLNNVTVSFNDAPAVNEFRIVVIG